MKKLVSLVIVMALVMSLAVGASAAGSTYTITVKDAPAKQTYTLYKIFDATVTDIRVNKTDGSDTSEVETPGISYTLPTGKSLDTEYTYTDSSNATKNVKGTNWFAVDTAGNVTAVKDADVSTEDFRQWAKQFGTQVGESKTVGDSDANVTFNNLTSGYYFVSTSTGALITVTSIAPNAIVKDKNQAPSISKVVSGGTETGSATPAINKEANTASIGDELTYTVTITAQPNGTNYEFKDTLDAGLVLNTAGITVKVNDTDLASTYYGVTTNTTETENQLTIAFAQSYLDTLTTATNIVITYKATVDTDAVIAGDGNKNTATLEYGTNDTTVSDSTTTYVYQFGLYKTATINNVKHTIISGAKFKMYDAATGGTEIKLTRDGDVYRPVIGAETADEIEAGNVIISGLKNGTYYLEETIAPEGYNKLTSRQSITITDANSLGTVTDNVYKESSGGLEVVNQAGTVLPSTGGVGTTIFYVLGGLMFVGALVLLVTNKRMKAE